MNKKVKSIIGWILYLALLVGLVWGVPKGLVYALKTDYPMASITSGSMWPELKKGDLVLIKGIDSKEEIKIGDIVVYQNPKGFTIHRVIKLDEDTLITKGDANNVNDAPVGYEEIIGKALTFNEKTVRIPFLGSLGLLINRNKI
jgi:signal peptidase